MTDPTQPFEQIVRNIELGVRPSVSDGQALVARLREVEAQQIGPQGLPWKDCYELSRETIALIDQANVKALRECDALRAQLAAAVEALGSIAAEAPEKDYIDRVGISVTVGRTRAELVAFAKAALAAAKGGSNAG